MFSRLMRAGLRKGLLEGSRPWLVVGIAAGSVRILRRLVSNEEQVVLREELPPGATLVIAHGAEGEPKVLGAGQ